MKSTIISSLLFCVFLLAGCSSGDSSRVIIDTNFGKIEIQLYENTPEHSANFVKLAKDGFYEGILFHRVIEGFMIQAGDPESKDAVPGARLGVGGPGYTVPAEILAENIHKRGALAAARLDDSVNPEKASSGSQFFIVHGKVYSDYDLDNIEIQTANRIASELFNTFMQQELAAIRANQTDEVPDSAFARANRRVAEWRATNPYKKTEEHRQIYKTLGGAPHLDGEYTVFGIVVKGMGVVDKIAVLNTDNADRPTTDVKIKRVRVK